MNIRVNLMATLLAAGLGLAALPAAAKTTVLDFEGMADGTILRDQYAYLGVGMLGGFVHQSASPLVPPHSGRNVVFTKSGFLSLTFDPAVAGPVVSVALYMSGSPATTIHAYDAAGIEIAAATMAPAVGPNARISIGANGQAIARVNIVGARASYVIDDLSFTTAAAATELEAAVQAIPAGAFRRHATAAQARLLTRVAGLERAIAATQPLPAIREQIDELAEALHKRVRPGAERAAALRALTLLAERLGIAVRGDEEGDEGDEHD